MEELREAEEEGGREERKRLKKVSGKNEAGEARTCKERQAGKTREKQAEEG